MPSPMTTAPRKPSAAKTLHSAPTAAAGHQAGAALEFEIHGCEFSPFMSGRPGVEAAGDFERVLPGVTEGYLWDSRAIYDD